MKITVKKILKIHRPSILLAYADIIIDNAIIIKGLRLMNGKNTPYVSMPQEQGKNKRWYDQVQCIRENVRLEIERVVIEAYEAEGKK